MDLMVKMGIALVLMETIMVYWHVMDSIGGMLNPIGKMPKKTLFFVMVLLEKSNGL